MDVGPPEIIIVVVIVLLVFGSSRIPEYARSIGRASGEYRRGLIEGHHLDADTERVGAPKTSASSDVPQR
jgi:sec-independent protein translocase protein TatA